LSGSQRVAATRDQHLRFFKQFTRGATDRHTRVGVGTVFHWRRCVVSVKLPTRESVKATEKSELFASLYEEDFRVIRVRGVTKEDDRSGVFGNWRARSGFKFWLGWLLHFGKSVHDQRNRSPSPGPHGTPRMW